MNRIVIIGNGFDIAHGLKTSYVDFIDHLKEEFITSVRTPVFQKTYMEHQLFGFGPAQSINKPENAQDIEIFYDETLEIKNWNDLDEHVLVKYECSTDHFPVKYNHYKARVHCKNKFLQYVLGNYKTKTWGGFEEDYKNKLMEIIHSNGSSAYTVEKLNEELAQIIKLLYQYLKGLSPVKGPKPDILNKLFTKPLESWKQQTRNIAKYGAITAIRSRNDIDTIHHVLFLSFNYTATIQKYLLRYDNRDLLGENIPIDIKKVNTETSLRYIHGELGDEDPTLLIFGYGDEFNENQTILENQTDEYLWHIKSVLYTRSPSYREVIDYADADKFDLIIYGHSCSNTDRTLLNTLFEHQNCISIQPFLYSPNSTSIYTNIYRCFKDKSLMRKRVVDETNTIRGF